MNTYKYERKKTKEQWKARQKITKRYDIKLENQDTKIT